jgi:hypothetical protein
MDNNNASPAGAPLSARSINAHPHSFRPRLYSRSPSPDSSGSQEMDKCSWKLLPSTIYDKIELLFMDTDIIIVLVAVITIYPIAGITVGGLVAVHFSFSLSSFLTACHYQSVSLPICHILPN